MGKTKGKKIALWSLTILLAAAYLMAGGAKLAGASQMVAEFTQWGYPAWFRILIGLAEVSGALLLLIPRLATLGAAGLSVVMVGAIFTHFKNGEGLRAMIPLVLLVLLALLGYARRPRRARETTRPSPAGDGASTR